MVITISVREHDKQYTKQSDNKLPRCRIQTARFSLYCINKQQRLNCGVSLYYRSRGDATLWCLAGARVLLLAVVSYWPGWHRTIQHRSVSHCRHCQSVVSTDGTQDDRVTKDVDSWPSVGSQALSLSKSFFQWRVRKNLVFTHYSALPLCRFFVKPKYFYFVGNKRLSFHMT